MIRTLLLLMFLSGCASTGGIPTDLLNTATLGCGTVAVGPGSVRAAWVKDMQNCAVHIDSNGCTIDCGSATTTAPPPAKP